MVMAICFSVLKASPLIIHKRHFYSISRLVAKSNERIYKKDI